MNDRLGLGALNAVRINVTHYIMSHNTFACLCDFEIDVIGMSLKLGNLLVCDIESELLFRLCKRDPQSAPCSEFEFLRKNILHFVAGVAGRKR